MNYRKVTFGRLVRVVVYTNGTDLHTWSLYRAAINELQLKIA